MKRCPKCARTYSEVDLNFCLDDGGWLVEDTGQPEPNTVILPAEDVRNDVHRTDARDDAETRQLTRSTEETAVLSIDDHRPDNPSGKGSKILVAGGMILAFLAGGLGFWLFRPAKADLPLRKLEFHLTGAVQQRDLAYSISPNGRMLAYVRDNKLWIRDLERTEPQEVANSAGADVPFWSPDSSQLGYFVEKKLFKVPNTGSGPTEIATIPAVMTGAAGATWDSDGSIVVATGERGLMRVSSQGGSPTPWLDVEAGEIDFHYAGKLPGGRGVLFSVHRSGPAGGSDTIELFDGKTRRKILQVPGAWLGDPVYSSSGHILYTRSNSPPLGIWAVPFSLDKLETTGEPFLIASGGSIASVSDDGSLVYARRATDVASRLVWVDRAGNVVSRIQAEDVLNQWPSTRLSPDGKQLVLSINARGAGMDPVIVDVASGSMTRVASQVDTNGAWFCTWTPDGKNVAYLKRNDTNRIVLKSPDGTGNENLLIEARDASFSPDGKFVIYTVALSGYSSSDIWYRSLNDGGQPVQFVVSDSVEIAPEFSPDGKFVAYVSNETGREEIFVKPFPDDGRKWQVSKQGGAVPRWSKRGDELFFNSANKIVSAPITTSPKVDFGQPQQLFDYQPLNLERISGSFESFDVSADGKRFVLLQQAPNQGSGLTLTFVQNWYAEFKGK